ncbi:MAG: IscS subfamily cysteine desulfurase [Chitinophagaceae bacterium]|jgi:cysteine desulfurase|nr:IscS subfamily cysteine desulfurase [Chitinophagaceae bacterium]
MIQYPIYMDYNATTPVDPRVMETMLPYYTTHFGNAASRTHAFGWVAEEAVSIAREQVGSLINAASSEIIFTSGATEAVNLTIRGVFDLYHAKGKHIITCNIEHKAVLDTCELIKSMGGEITILEVMPNGLPDLSVLEKAIRADTILISIMYANNEIGTIMPIAEIGAIAKKHGVLFFSDATQAVGKIPVDVIKDNIDLLALSAHKLYGPKGVGALYVRRKNPRVKLKALQYGGGHEKGMRSGTLNVPGIVGLGKACAISKTEMDVEIKRISKLRDQLLNGLLALGCTALNGEKNNLLPHVANVSFSIPGANQLIHQLQKQIAVSSGSACTSASTEPSYVLKALGIGDELAAGSIRFSLGRFTTEKEIVDTIHYVTEVVNNMR